MKIFRITKKPALKSAVVLAMVLVLVMTAACGGEESYRQIKIHEIEGSATVTREGTGDVEPYVNMMLQNKDEAATATESYVQLQLDQDKYILMEPSTKILIEATGNETDSKTKINLTQGAIVNKIEKSLSENSTYEVTTPSSTMAVRGTTFRVEVTVDEKGESYTTLTVCEGKVECRLIAPDGTVSEEPVIVEEGEQVKIRGTQTESEYVGDKGNFDYEEFKEKVLWFVGYVEEEVTELETETETILETEIEEEELIEESETEEEEKVSEVKEQTVISETEEVVEEPVSETPPVVTPPADTGSTGGGSTDSGSSNSGSGSSGSGTTAPATYTVTFKDSTGNVFATKKVTGGSTATQPILSPEGAGGWNFNFSTAITADTEILWTPN